MQRLIQSTEACCSHLVAMNQAAFKILSVVPGRKRKRKKKLSMRLSKQCYWFVLYAKVPQPLFFPYRDGLPQKRSQKWVDSDFTSSISLVSFCVAAPVSFPYEFLLSSQTRPWRLSLSSMPLVCHLCHLPPLVPAGIPPVWVECEDSSACATMPHYSQAKHETCGPGVPLICLHSPPNLSLLPW